MSAASEICMSFDPQLQSKFPASPTEIRHAIYAYLIPDRVHLSLYDTTLRIIPCVQRANDADPNCDSRKWYDGVPVTDSNTLDALILAAYSRRGVNIGCARRTCWKSAKKTRPTSQLPFFACAN
jgi:hypothetical protein